MIINRKLLWLGGLILLICFTSTYSMSQQEEEVTEPQQEEEVMKLETESVVTEAEKPESEAALGEETAEEGLSLEADEEPLEFTAEELEFEIPEEMEFIEMEEVPEEQKAQAPAEGLVNLTFKDADVTDVLAALAQQTGMNIIWGDEVQGMVTLRLENVPWEQALNMILKSNKLAHEKKENVIRVTTIERLNQEKEAELRLAQTELEKEPLVTHVVTLNFADAGETAAILEELLTKNKEGKEFRGTITADARTNSLLIKDIASNITELTRVADLIDTQTPQVMIEARVVETSATLVRELGVDWAIQGSKLVPTHYKGAALDPILDKLLGSEIETSDTYTATTEDGTSTSSETYTRSYSTPESDERRTKRLEIDHKGGQLKSQLLDDEDLESGGVFKLGILDAYGFEIAMKALDSDADTKVLSNPRVATVDNREAYILVGEEVPIVTRDVTSGAAEAQEIVYSVSFKDVGTKLKVTAQINQDDMINLKIAPEISEVGEWRQLSANAEYPVMKTKKADVEVLVKSGETVVIGGFIYEKEINTVSKIPFLGDIPVLGWAFKKKRREKEDKEILVFVTPTIFGREEKKEIVKELVDIEGDDTLQLIEKQEFEGVEEQKAFDEIQKEIEEIEKEEDLGQAPPPEEQEKAVKKEEETQPEPEQQLEIEGLGL